MLGRMALLAATNSSAYSSAAQDYINRVIAADVAAGNSSGLETATQNAIAAFIDGLISDGLLGTSGGVISQASSVIKAACIMAGAQTLSGALVPLVGTAPTNANFVTADYNRKTGLKGNGANKYLTANRNNNNDPQNNRHLAVYITQGDTTWNFSRFIWGGDTSQAGDSQLCNGSSGDNNLIVSLSNLAINTGFRTGQPNGSTGLYGASRTSSSSFSVRANGQSLTGNYVSAAPTNRSIYIYGSPTETSPVRYVNARMSFYSIGEALTLTNLESRLSTLMTALAAAIP
jgi:hypothetical protein